MNLYNLDPIKEFLPTASIDVFLSFDLTARTKEHRLKIRKEVLKSVSEKKIAINGSSLLDLSQPPGHPEISISISHCGKASGFALTDKPHIVGFDVEDSDRISDKVIKRISSEKEIKNTPNPKVLLSAKEACWKAANKPTQIATISHIETSDWKPVTQNWSLFKANNIKGHGFLLEHSGIYLSFFIFNSTFV